MSGPVNFGKARFGLMSIGGGGTILRYSSALRALRRMPNADGRAIKDFMRDKEIVARCDVHGPIADPIVGICQGRVAFACPWCSGPELLAAWKKEGDIS